MVSQALMSSKLCAPRQATSASISGRPLVSRPQQQRSIARRGAPVAAETKEAEKKDEKKEEKKPFSPPALDPNTPSPIFGGSTGGLLRKAQVEEFHVITWEAKKEAIFEMPTGGAAAMRQGPNLLKLSRKEQCLALLTQLRNKFKLNGQIYRVFPNGEVQYLHPKDGQYPEKVTPGRNAVNTNDRRIGDNTNPIKIKFTGKAGTFDL